MLQHNRILAVAATALLLGGCAGLELGRTTGLTPSGTDFNKALFSEYLALSREEYNEGDYKDSDDFALRAQASAAGQMVQPEAIAARRLPGDKVGELTGARAQLVAALDGNARTRVPGPAARAQAMFDCWMEEQHENFQPVDIARCRSEFQAAMAQLGAPPPMAAAPAPMPRPAARTFIVFFDHNSATLTPEGQTIVRNAATFARESNAARVELVGHADRSGTDQYNIALSQRRGTTVRSALGGQGVRPAIIAVTARGESAPLVPTADGVREPQNRRVEVRVVP